MEGSTAFREDTTSALAGFLAGLVSWSNWNLEMLVFVEGRKPEYTKKNTRSEARSKEELNPKNYGPTPGSNLGQIGGRWALSSLLHPCSNTL